jgi:ornithine carbamoyltransferase
MPAGAPAGPILKASAGDFASDLDLSCEEVGYLLDLAAQVKSSPAPFADALRGRSISLLFEKPSLRTRLTFELAMKQLGGDSILSNGIIGEREPLQDVARNLDRWTQGIVARVFSQATVDELARWSKVPVVNALSDLYHPCQALADILTLREHFGSLAGLNLAFVGDGNNVAHSLMLSAVRLGVNFSLATPPGYEANPEIVKQAEALAAVSGARLRITTDPEEAVAGASAVYTDVWTSMGHEEEAEERQAVFRSYQVNSQLLRIAGPQVLFMHCQPARRGEEMTDDVIDSPRSIVYDQAENRLHMQKAILLTLLF